MCIWGAEDAYGHHAGQTLSADPLTQKYIQFAYDFYRQPLGCSHAVIGEPPGPHEPGVAWAEQPGCAIWIAHSTLPWEPSSFTRRERDWQYCGTILHEVGHNLGLTHVTGTVKSPMNVEHSWNHPGCWTPYHVLHCHKHRHRKRVHGKVRVRIHCHKHYHLKVGRP